ncbi:MAG TPA: hypothetical protein VFX31_01630 [Ktedonobacterales bacterium]|nr:hypothetical protein [Ktedonobacterales bacterium]
MTLGVLCTYLESLRDPTLSRRQKRKARVAWLLLRSKRHRWHCRGTWRAVNQAKRRHRVTEQLLSRMQAEIDTLRALMPQAVRPMRRGGC